MKIPQKKSIKIMVFFLGPQKNICLYSGILYILKIKNYFQLFHMKIAFKFYDIFLCFCFLIDFNNWGCYTF